MQVNIEKQYPIGAGEDAAWKVLADMRELASCMPGAEITEQIDPTHYKGVMRLKVGPASAIFNGELEVLELNEAEKRVRFKGKGAERSGSSAVMDLTAALGPATTAGSCVLHGNAQISVSGKFAQFGARMMNSVADMMLERFTQTFSQKAAALAAPAMATGPAAEARAEQTAAAAEKAPTPRPVAELNVLSFIWDAIKRFFGGLMQTRK